MLWIDQYRYGAPTPQNWDLWFDASDTATITLTSSAVSTFANKIIGGGDFTQATAGQRPVMGATVNGLDTIKFDGGNDALIHAQWLTNDVFDMFVVFRTVSNDNQHIIGQHDGDTNTHAGSIAFVRELDGSIGQDNTVAAIALVESGPTPVNGPHVQSVFDNVVHCVRTYSAGDGNIWQSIDGAPALLVLASAPFTPPNEQLVLGNSNSWNGGNPGAHASSMQFCELQGMTAVQSSFVADQIISYLMAKWGVSTFATHGTGTLTTTGVFNPTGASVTMTYAIVGGGAGGGFGAGGGGGGGGRVLSGSSAITQPVFVQVGLAGTGGLISGTVAATDGSPSRLIGADGTVYADAAAGSFGGANQNGGSGVNGGGGGLRNRTGGTGTNHSGGNSASGAVAVNNTAGGGGAGDSANGQNATASSNTAGNGGAGTNINGVGCGGGGGGGSRADGTGPVAGTASHGGGAGSIAGAGANATANTGGGGGGGGFTAGAGRNGGNGAAGRVYLS